MQQKTYPRGTKVGRLVFTRSNYFYRERGLLLCTNAGAILAH